MKTFHASFGLLLLATALLPTAVDSTRTRRCTERYVDNRRLTHQDTDDSKATVLEMYDCDLYEMKIEHFRGLPQLDVVHLQNSLLEHINQAALCLVPTITELHLSYNKLRELPVLDGRWCSNLTDLYVDGNLLTAIPNEMTFSSCVKLYTLELQWNDIEYLHPGIFSRLSELKYLRLNNNKLRLLPPQMYVNNRYPGSLDINNNIITHLPPNFASGIKRAGAGLGLFHFRDNPWHCACVLELLADVKRSDVEFYWQAGFDGRQPVCTYSGPEPCCRRAPSGLLRPAPPPAL